ncbi:MAG: Lin0512 family protein [Arenibacterium sp.]
MTEQRVIVEMGMGNDQYGQDYTKAARRAIEDAIRHSSLPIFQALEMSSNTMRVQVTVGVQKPEQVDTDALLTALPRGRAEVIAALGGLNVDNPDTGGTIVIATAAVEAFLPKQSGWRLRSAAGEP